MRKLSSYLQKIQIITSIFSIVFGINAFLNDDGNWGLSNKALILWSFFFSFMFFIILIEKIILDTSNLFLVKIMMTLSIMSFVYICIAEASNLINEVYPVNPELFPFTKIFLSGIIFFKKIYDPFLWICFVLIIVYYGMAILSHILLTIKEPSYRGLIDSWKFFGEISWLYICPIIILLYFSYQLNNNYFSEQGLRVKIPIIARILDFYENSNCKIDKKSSQSRLLYLDNLRDYILVDDSEYRIENFDLWDIITYTPENSKWISFIPYEKQGFRIIKCNQKEIAISKPLKP